MTGHATHRLDGLEPDNLLAFMALLGLLRALEKVRPDWCPRVSWTVDEPPLRPCLRVAKPMAEDAIVEATVEGLKTLARYHDFGELSDLTLLPTTPPGGSRTPPARTDTRPICGRRLSATPRLLVTAKRSNRHRFVSCSVRAISISFLASLRFRRRQCRRNEVSVTTNPRLPKRNVCVRRCSPPGSAPMRHRHSDGTPMKTCAMRYAREIQPTQ